METAVSTVIADPEASIYPLSQNAIIWLMMEEEGWGLEPQTGQPQIMTTWTSSPGAALQKVLAQDIVLTQD
jgi:hypothetical protein